MILKPIGERVVVKKLEKKEKTASGLILPTSAQEKPQYAEVVAIGTKVLLNDDLKDTIKVGDKVICARYSGTEVSLDSVDYTVLNYDEVLAVIEE